jgi:hypothetical protein
VSGYRRGNRKERIGEQEEAVEYKEKEEEYDME